MYTINQIRTKRVGYSKITHPFLLLLALLWCGNMQAASDTTLSKQDSLNLFFGNIAPKNMVISAFAVGVQARLFSTVTVEGQIGYDILITGGNAYPVVSLQPRIGTMLKYYYNVERRMRKGKNAEGFSGNYFALGTGNNARWLPTNMPDLRGSVGPGYFLISFNSIGIKYGWQRAFGKSRNWYIDISGGGAYYYLKGFGSHLGPGVSMRFGFFVK